MSDTATNGTGTQPKTNGSAQPWRTWTPERLAKFQKTMAAKRREREQEAKSNKAGKPKKARKTKEPTKHGRTADNTGSKGLRISDAIAFLEEAQDTADEQAKSAYTLLALKRLQGRI